MSHIRPQNQRKTPPERGKDGMGAPGIEAGNLATTTTYYVLLWPTETGRLHAFLTPTTYSVPLRPPTCGPPTGHCYNWQSGQR
jgi:hypothetical protein